jgi:hypothetical protein
MHSSQNDVNKFSNILKKLLVWCMILGGGASPYDNFLRLYNYSVSYFW